MSYSKFATQADRENAANAVVEKPVVHIHRASIGKRPCSDNDVMWGYPVDHPRDYLNDREIRTSAILKVDGTTVETRNTIYKVLSWDNKALNVV